MESLAFRGICCLSGWAGADLLRRGAVKQPSTPTLHCHGTADTTVPFAAGKKSAETLRSLGCSALDFKAFVGLDHGPNDAEYASVADFLLKVLPRSFSMATTPREIVCRTSMGDKCRVEIDVPEDLDIKDILLDLSPVELRISGAIQLQVPWPRQPVDVAAAKARFRVGSRMLVVTGPLKELDP